MESANSRAPTRSSPSSKPETPLTISSTPAGTPSMTVMFLTLERNVSARGFRVSMSASEILSSPNSFSEDFISYNGGRMLEPIGFMIFCTYSCFCNNKPKTQLHFCDHALLIVRMSLIFRIFYFFSSTTDRILKKLNRKPVLNANKYFFSDRSVNKDDRPGIWLVETFLTPFLQILTNLDRKEVLNALYQVCSSGQSVNKDGHQAVIG